MRADAQRNRGLLLTAARQAFIAYGANARIDDIARSAGVGTGTLYRHFPTRIDLLRAVARDVLERTNSAGRTALAEESNSLNALRRYMHEALDIGIAVMAAIAEPLSTDAATAQARDAVAATQHELIERAQAGETLRHDIDFADIGLAIVRFSQPIGPRLDPLIEPQLAHRHLDIFIDGLQRIVANPLPGQGLSLVELREMRDVNHGQQDAQNAVANPPPASESRSSNSC